MDNKSKAAAILIAILILGLTAYAVYAFVWVKPGAYIEGTVTITYDDGTTVTIDSGDRQLFNFLQYQAKQQNVVTYQNKKLMNIACDIAIRFSLDPPDKTVRCQYWMMFWLEVEGPFFTGARAYSGLLGFFDTPLRHYESKEGFNKWSAKVGNPELGWLYVGSFVDPFYRETTSSVWVDLTTYIANPKAVTDALNGIPIVGWLADTLSAHLTATDVRHGQRPIVMAWEKDGPGFYVRLKRSNFEGLSVHVGDFSIGAGKFCRMWPNDGYSIRFKAGYFFRYRDITGEWSKWKHGTVTIADFEMRVEEGQWYVLSVDVEGGVKVD